MKFDVTINPDDLNAIPELAKIIEDAGFDGIWTPETSHNPFLPLSLGAVSTQRVNLGTAIAIAFARSPMVTAHLAWDLAAQSKGRFILGLGTQIKAHITRRFGMEWGQPGPRLRDYILALKAIWETWQTNVPLNYRGEFYKHTLMTPFFQPVPLENPHIPIYIAGVNEYLCRLAGELCDGFHVHPFHTVEYLKDFIVPNVQAGAEKAGRSRADVALTCAIFVVTGKNQREIEDDKAAIKSQIAFYASTPSYRPVLEHHGLGDLQDRLGQYTREGRWLEMYELISDELLDKVAVVAPYEDLAQAVQERYAGLLDRIGYYMPYVAGSQAELWESSLKAWQR